MELALATLTYFYTVKTACGDIYKLESELLIKSEVVEVLEKHKKVFPECSTEVYKYVSTAMYV